MTFEDTSVSATADTLRSLGALWCPRPQDKFRRHALVQEKLPRFRPKPRRFPFLVPEGRLGAWALQDGAVWASAETRSPFPGGDPHLEENKIDPPSSAYLKLQEALLLLRSWPQPGQRCLDAGSCPGGWTWVLAETGAQVRSVDRSPLDPRLLTRPNVAFQTGNAFALRPEDTEALDWLCSDVVCYPAKLWSWLEPWIESGKAKRLIITIKMQGPRPDWETLDRFAAVPGSQLVHLHHNKHELTWLL
jgi:23S rRNA (cytidine2498-2'-O)-methyltransferase